MLIHGEIICHQLTLHALIELELNHVDSYIYIAQRPPQHLWSAPLSSIWEFWGGRWPYIYIFIYK